jgi:hypothetical protein
MKNTKLYLPHVLLLSVIASPAVAQDNPFEYKPEAPVVQAESRPAPPPNPDLSALQRNTVLNIIREAMEASQLNADGNDGTVLLEGKKYLLLQSDERYLGLTSGMHLVISDTSLEYKYFDSKKYHGVITSEEFNGIKEEAENKVSKALSGSSKDERQVESTSRFNESGIKPVKIQ